MALESGLLVHLFHESNGEVMGGSDIEKLTDVVGFGKPAAIGGDRWGSGRDHCGKGINALK